MTSTAIVKLLGYCLVAIVVLAGLFFDMKKSSSQEQAKTGNIVPEPTKVPSAYKIIKSTCTSKRGCLIFAEVNKNWFVSSKMKDLAVQLRNDFADYKHVRVLLFDNAQVATEYLGGIRAPKDIDKDIRGVYEYNQDKFSEFIEFSPEEGGKFNKVRISLN